MSLGFRYVLLRYYWANTDYWGRIRTGFKWILGLRAVVSVQQSSRGKTQTLRFCHRTRGPIPGPACSTQQQTSRKLESLQKLSVLLVCLTVAAFREASLLVSARHLLKAATMLDEVNSLQILHQVGPKSCVTFVTLSATF